MKVKAGRPLPKYLTINDGRPMAVLCDNHSFRFETPPRFDLVVAVDGRPVQKRPQHLTALLVWHVIYAISNSASPLDDVLHRQPLLGLNHLPGPGDAQASMAASRFM